MSDSSIEEENNNDKYKLENIINKANEINKSEKGTGDDFDEIHEDDPLYKASIKKIVSKEEFLVTDEKSVIYRLIKVPLRDEGRKLIVFPGFSIKSYSWTVGRINRFLKDYPINFESFSEIYIFMFDEVKPIQLEEGVEQFYDKKYNHKIGEHLNKIINSVFRDQDLTVIGRSAGGDLSLMLRHNGIKDLHLASVGTSPEVLENFLDEVKIPIKLYFHNNDEMVKMPEADERIKLIRNKNYSNWQYTIIFDDRTKVGETHRIHKELIFNL
jgi:hypothetical protein